VVSTVLCEIPHGDRFGHQESREMRLSACMQEARRGDGRAKVKRARLMSALGQEIVGPGFSSLTRAVVHGACHEGGKVVQMGCGVETRGSG
jgi:hypothetical protein